MCGLVYIAEIRYYILNKVDTGEYSITSLWNDVEDKEISVRENIKRLKLGKYGKVW
jgi:hypothetical protein